MDYIQQEDFGGENIDIPKMTQGTKEKAEAQTSFKT